MTGDLPQRITGMGFGMMGVREWGMEDFERMIVVGWRRRRTGRRVWKKFNCSVASEEEGLARKVVFRYLPRVPLWLGTSRVGVWRQSLKLTCQTVKHLPKSDGQSGCRKADHRLLLQDLGPVR